MLDVIIVLSGGIKGNSPHLWVTRRLKKAIELYNNNNKIPIICSSGGTSHKPPLLDKDNYVIFESKVCANYLIQQNIPTDKIFQEWSSYDTIGNAYFVLMNHIIPNKWTNIAVITSEFHMERSKAIFDWVFGLELYDSSIQKVKYNLQYHTVSDMGFDQSVISSRVIKEKQSLDNIKILSQQITTMKQFYSWLFTQHSLYNNTSINHQEENNIECIDSY